MRRASEKTQCVQLNVVQYWRSLAANDFDVDDMRQRRNSHKPVQDVRRRSPALDLRAEPPEFGANLNRGPHSLSAC